MKFIIAVNHPAQYHLFKVTYSNLQIKGHSVVFVIKDKDILSELMKNENVQYHLLLKKRIGNNRLGILFKGFLDIIGQGTALYKFVKTYKPDLMFGTDYSITHVGKIIGIPTIVFNEDDFEINKFFCKLSYPWASCIVSPTICDVGRYKYKKINYEGYQKLAYLHPNVFQPDKSVVEKYIDKSKKFFLIRLVSFSAGHDIEMKHAGINENVLENIIHILEKHGKVFISSESKIPDRFLQFKLEIDVQDMHHFMAFATLIIADSQSMIVEASMLGIPSIRFNSFVGKISVLDELEKKYKLTIGIRNDKPDLLYDELNKFLDNKDFSAEFLTRKNRMLSQKINVSAFILWFIENFPDSGRIIRKNPDYQNNFI